MSPKSRGRPPGRGRKKRPAGRGTSASHLRVVRPAQDCWFDDPVPGDRRSWVMPPAHGTYRGLELEALKPEDDDHLLILLEAYHPELQDALRAGEDLQVDGEPVNPRLHLLMHQSVARQLLDDDPPETWQAVRRLAGLGYDWHNITHMIAALVTENAWRAQAEQTPFDPEEYVRQLAELPGDWPAP